jgi:hypothetical protein
MAEKDLNKLLAQINPQLREGKFYFASVDEGNLMSLANYLDYIAAIFREDEGLTIVFRDDVKAEMVELSEKKIHGPFALITLGVNSDLDAVGFLAKITEALAKEKISVNAFSAYHHDHLFVPFERKEDALAAIGKLKANL